MARQIRLRFPATCFDCGASLDAGSLARWFGRGRVSCCGGDRPSNTATVNGRDVKVPIDTSDPARIRRVRQVSPPITPHPMDTPGPSGLTEEQLNCGIGSDQLPALVAATPNLLLLVRLTSGARFLVPAEHADHVIRAIEESLRDKVRDVTRSPKQ